ncbi:MAG TPA: alpha/beta hydrolase [Fimbriimonadaceae bacterium]|nr:alpha/beta hydrolase [Fimbriimonadaceae bacterium]
MSQVLVEVHGGQLAAVIVGAGSPLLVLHGGPGLSDYTEPLASELSEGHCVIRYQQRGLFPSTTSGPFTIERHVADALAVLDAAGAERALIVGHSWGGFLAMHLAASHQERLTGLVVIDSLGAIGDGGLAEFSACLVERCLPMYAARLAELNAQQELSAAEMIEHLALIWSGYFGNPEAAPPMPVLRMSPECSSGTWESIWEHFGRGTLEESLPKVQVPTVFVLGSKSPMPIDRGSESAALIPGARCIVEEGCGHFPWLERPGSIRRAIDSLVPTATQPGSVSPRH